MTFRHGPLLRGFTILCLAGAPLLFAAEGMSSAGIRWTIPAGWAAQPARQMRVATYTLPAVAGAEPGECGVFYFGQGRGGSARENIARWGTQFENAPSPATVIETVDGMKVHRVQTSGTYLAPAGPMMQPSGKKPGYRLMGAIVEAPEGLVFFKSTGPARTMATAERAFDGLVKSIRKVPAKKF